MFAIADDGLGNLWLSGNHGIRRVARRDLEAIAAGRATSLAATMLGRADGMSEVECSGGVQPAVARSSDGRLWFPTIDGVVVVSPGAVRENPVPPRVVVETVTVDGQQQPLGAPLRLPPDTRQVQIQYTAPSLSNADRVRLRHRLAGSEEAFLDAGKERVVHYVGLGPGRYRFELSAANESGLWSPPLTLVFEIQPRLWQRRGVQALAAAVALAAAAMRVGQRTRRLVRQRLELEQRVQQELSRVKVLQGVLPICAWCKKVRDDAGYWKRIEVYVGEHSQAEFTHGICPECETRMDGEEPRAGAGPER